MGLLFRYGLAVLIGLSCAIARADEGGVSFWLPGQFGSLAAVPAQAGWSMPLVYYHTSVDAGGGRNLRVGGNVVAGLDADANLVFAAPTYTFETPLWGAQAATALLIGYGHMTTSADAILTGPRGRTFERKPSDSVTGGTDLYSLNTLKWNDGVNNYLAYLMAGVPVGAYQRGRLANIGTHHWSLDAGGGYTYFDKQTGREASAVLGLTYNFVNADTHYQNGMDAHLDWALSQFINPQIHFGIVGYVYQQISADSGSGAVLGSFKSRALAVGPQAGYFFAAARRQWYVNLKGYYEYDAAHRPQGWNTWLTLLIPLEPGRAR